MCMYVILELPRIRHIPKETIKRIVGVKWCGTGKIWVDFWRKSERLRRKEIRSWLGYHLGSGGTVAHQSPARVNKKSNNEVISASGHCRRFPSIHLKSDSCSLIFRDWIFHVRLGFNLPWRCENEVSLNREFIVLRMRSSSFIRSSLISNVSSGTEVLHLGNFPSRQISIPKVLIPGGFAKSYPSRKFSIDEVLYRESFSSGKFPIGEVPHGEKFSIGEVLHRSSPSGKFSIGEVLHRGSSQSEKFSIGEVLHRGSSQPQNFSIEEVLHDESFLTRKFPVTMEFHH